MKAAWAIPALALLLSGPAGAYTLFPTAVRGTDPSPAVEDAKDHDRNEVLLRINNTGQIGQNVSEGRGVGSWPRGTGNNYVFGGGLLFGGIADVDGDGTEDKAFVVGYDVSSGYSEFAPGRTGQDPDDPLARIFDANDPGDLAEWPDEFRDPVTGAPIVHSVQDFVTIGNDVSGSPIFGASNLGIEVRQRSMAFAHDLSRNAIYFEWDLTNVSASMPHGPYTFRDAWIGFDMDADVGEAFDDDLASAFRDVVTDGGDTLTLDAAYVWDFDFDEGNFVGRPGFLGLALLQGPGNPSDGIDNDGDGLVDESPFNGLDDDGDGDVDEPDEVDELGLVNFSRHCGFSVPCQVKDPEDDPGGYDLLDCRSPYNPDSTSRTDCLESTTPSEIRFMISSGPFDWLPGQTIRIRLAFVFAPAVGAIERLDFVGDPPRPDPNDPALADFIASLVEVRNFGRSGYTDYGALPSVNDMFGFLPVNLPSFAYPATAAIYDTVGIARASLRYAIDGGPFETLDLAYAGDGLYEGAVPGPGYGSVVDLFYEAVDSLFRMTRDPGDAPLTTYHYEVVHLPAFTDVTAEAGLDGASTSTDGATAIDYDGDGDLDLSMFGGSRFMLYRNEGNGTFADGGPDAGIPGRGVSSAAWADYDNDGDLDLFTAAAGEDRNDLYRSRGDGTFDEVADSAGVATPGFMQDAVWGDYDNDGFIDLYLYSHGTNGSAHNALFHNDGDGTFTDVAGDLGLRFSWPGYSSSQIAVWVDADDDGWLDLFLTDPVDRVARLFRNDMGVAFTDIAGASDLRDADSGEIQFIDYDDDGDLDLITGDAALGLFRNDGGGAFSRLGPGDGPDAGVFFDADNSGFLDAAVPESPGVFYANNGGVDFSRIERFYGAEVYPRFRHPVPIDFDDDGDSDLLVLNWRPTFHRNEGFAPEYTDHWLRVKCEGTASNRAGIGAKVRLTTGDHTQTRIVGGARGKGQEDLVVAFGLGDAPVVDRLVIEWPSGKVQAFSGLGVNRTLTVIEDSTLVGIGDGGDGAPGLPRAFALSQNYPNPFNPSTTIRYEIPAGAGVKSGAEAQSGDQVSDDAGAVPVRLRIYDLRGRLVRTLVDRDREPGRYVVHWDGRDDRGARVGSGVYLYRIECGGVGSRRVDSSGEPTGAATFIQTRKMVVVR